MPKNSSSTMMMMKNGLENHTIVVKKLKQPKNKINQETQAIRVEMLKAT